MTAKYVLTANGISYQFEEYGGMVEQIAHLGLVDYEIEVVEPHQMVVTNLMSGKPIIIAKDTPMSCDPSTETYWSM